MYRLYLLRTTKNNRDTVIAYKQDILHDPHALFVECFRTTRNGKISRGSTGKKQVLNNEQMSLLKWTNDISYLNQIEAIFNNEDETLDEKYSKAVKIMDKSKCKLVGHAWTNFIE